MSQHDTSSAGRWTSEEHDKFLIGLQMFGKNWKKIEEVVKTRNGSQIRSHAQKYFLKLKKSGKYNEDPSQYSKQKIHDFQSPIQRSFTNFVQKQSTNYSYFMEKIVQYTKNHQNLDIWDALIDDGSHKEAITQIDSVPHSESLQKEVYLIIDNIQPLTNKDIVGH